MVQAIHQTTEIPQLLFDFRWSMPLLCGSCSFSCAAVETFLALPQLQLVEKSSPVFSRLQKTVDFPQLQFINIVVVIPFVPQTQILMVQTIQQITEYPQLQYVSGARCPCCVGRVVFLLVVAGQDLRHLGRYGPKGQLLWQAFGRFSLIFYVKVDLGS